mgnify:CR=1 FL=1
MITLAMVIVTWCVVALVGGIMFGRGIREN